MSDLKIKNRPYFKIRKCIQSISTIINLIIGRAFKSNEERVGINRSGERVLRVGDQDREITI